MDDSIDVASELLDTLECNEINTFKRLLEDVDVEVVEKRHQYRQNSTYLEIACVNGQSNFVALLIEKGAQVNSYHPERLSYTLHTVCKNGHHECVEILLKNGANVNAQDGHGGQTPLHVLLGEWKESRETPTLMFPFDPIPPKRNAKFAKCFQLLLDEPEIDLNITNAETDSPLELAVKKRNRFAIKILLDHGARLTDRARQAINKIEEPIPGLLHITNREVDKDDVDRPTNLEERIREAVGRNDHKQMQRLLQIPGFHALENDLQLKGNLLYYPERQFQMLTDYKKGSSLPRRSISGSLPPFGRSIILAAWRGSDVILRLLVEDPLTDVNTCDLYQQTALHIVALRLKANPVQYTKCLHVLLSSNKISVDPTDYLGNSPLHYAVQAGVEDAILALLHKGANLCLKNKARKLPLTDIVPTTMEKFFDECVIKKGEEENSISCCVTFDYKFLANTAPSKLVSEKANSKLGANATYTKDAERHVSFKENIEFLDEKISRSSDTTHVTNFYPESRALKYLASSPRHQHLVRHPLVASFLHLKWQKVKRFFYMNSSLYILSLVTLTFYIVTEQSHLETKIPSATHGDGAWYVLFVLTSLHLVREFLQFAFAPLFYLSSLENYLQLGMIVQTTLMLFMLSHQAAALAVLCAYGAFFIAIGKCPQNALRVTKFFTVANNFMKELMLYSVLLVGFSLSLHLTFNKGVPGKTNELGSNSSSKTPGDNDSFATYYDTLLKMFAMMIGELEFSDLNFSASPITSRLTFVCFLFLITIVLFNLLGGLAVSDIQAIESQSEIISNQRLIELTFSLELLSFNHPSYCLSHCSLVQWVRRLSGGRHCHCLQIASLPRFVNWSSLQLLGECLPDKCFTVFVNAFGHPKEDIIGTPKCRCHINFSLPREIVEAACELKQETAKRQESLAESFTKLENRIENLQQTVKLHQKQVMRLRNKSFASAAADSETEVK